jgi:7-cyano-7-deazaguanine synthase
MDRKKAVLLLSGGLDSTTLLALASSEGRAIHALSFGYGQRHSAELAAARKIASHFHVVQHVVTDIDLRAFGGSALTADIDVPKDQAIGESAGIPVTYVPARNTIFLSFALAWAEVLGASDIFIGVNALDYSGYPDCRPEFIQAFEKMAQLATRAGVESVGEPVRIRAPLIELSKREIILLGTSLGVDYGMTTSCYDPEPDGAACGHCDACQLRLKGFEEAGLADPARYASVR